MALLYLVNKPQVLGKIVKWLLFFSEYDLIVIYKLGKTYVITDVLLKLLDVIKPSKVSKQTVGVSLFFTKPKWLNDVKMFLQT
jgi:hypothetical protein